MNKLKHYNKNFHKEKMNNYQKKFKNSKLEIIYLRKSYKVMCLLNKNMRSFLKILKNKMII